MFQKHSKSKSVEHKSIGGGGGVLFLLLLFVFFLIKVMKWLTA